MVFAEEIGRNSQALDMPRSKSHQLNRAARERRFVRFSRRFEEYQIRGYVVAVGVKFFLLALGSDRFWFDGFECFQINDIRKLRPDPYAAFAEAALKKRGERMP